MIGVLMRGTVPAVPKEVPSLSENELHTKRDRNEVDEKDKILVFPVQPLCSTIFSLATCGRELFFSIS